MTTRLETVAAESMSDFWKHLEKGHFDASIRHIRSLGYAAAAVDFALSRDSYYLLTHEGSDIRRPSDVPDDMIPVVAVERTESYRFETPVLHSLQRAALAACDIDAETVTQTFQESGRVTLAATKTGTETASVYRRLAPLPGRVAQAESRPMVIFNPDADTARLEPTCPSAVLHELVHVAQSLSDPLWNEQDRLQKELEAYAVQAQLVSSYQVDYSGAMAMAGQVNLQRSRYLGPDGYEPSPEFIDFARHDVVLSKIMKEGA